MWQPGWEESLREKDHLYPNTKYNNHYNLKNLIMYYIGMYVVNLLKKILGISTKTINVHMV